MSVQQSRQFEGRGQSEVSEHDALWQKLCTARPQIDLGKDACVVVFADWCGNCTNMRPALLELRNFIARNDLPVNMLQCYNFGQGVTKLQEADKAYVAQKLHPKHFPTIQFFRQGVMIPYEGGHDFNALSTMFGDLFSS